ncbi:myotubularin-related protein 10-like [Pollicipes pollicipes]|uniref:myotubularin-related protein 10-like n=1 Tax=Pollicipes pollicipes TaxID=41117 RepID=UPI001885300E|nr:myotubularin-related protein 10-like [Pollicipes pollicipes]
MTAVFLQYSKSKMAKSRSAKNFQSYLELDDNIGNGSASAEQVSLEPQLLLGETMVAAADSVLLYLPMSEQRQGLSGRLHVTNFKLSFVTLHSLGGGPTEEPRRNKLLGKHDVCLMNVDCIYQLSSNGKRKLLAPRSNVAGRIKALQIRCKDFRVVTFSFKCSRLDEDRAITNALLLYCYPLQPHLIFAFDYKAEAPFEDVDADVESECGSAAGWAAALNRTGTVGWRISHANDGFQMCSSLPEVLVVPNGVLDTELRAASGHYVDSRPPVWCWGHPDGSAIARAAYTQPAGRHSQEEQMLLDTIRSSHPFSKEPVKQDVGVTCPSVEEVQESYVKLREICSPESVRSFVETDGRFLGLLGASRWPSAVSRCLSAAADCVRTLAEHRTVVILTEPSGRDLTAVVSCLAQLMVDPHCRSLAGFQRLLHREWVALGHPFQERLGLVYREGGTKSPVFLLLLDCVHQLLEQFPARFEFTETYLISLWDSLHVSVFDTFLFNSEKERLEAVSAKEHDYPLCRRPVWHWSAQLDADQRRLFKNPMYQPTSVAALRLWTRCFCRWVPNLDVVRGGRAADEECERRLRRQLDTLEAQLESKRAGVGVRRSARASAVEQPLPNAFFPFVECRAPTPLLSVTPGLVNVLVRNSIVACDEDGLAAQRGRQYGL